MKVKVVNVVGVTSFNRPIPLERLAERLQDRGFDVDVIEIHESIWRLDLAFEEGKACIYRSKAILFANNNQNLQVLAKKAESVIREVLEHEARP